MKPIRGVVIVPFLVAAITAALGAAALLQKRQYGAAAFFVVVSLFITIADAIILAQWLQQP